MSATQNLADKLMMKAQYTLVRCSDCSSTLIPYEWEICIACHAWEMEQVPADDNYEFDDAYVSPHLTPEK